MEALNAVQKGQSHEVDDAVWMTSVSLQGANLAFHDMAKVFKVDPAK